MPGHVEGDDAEAREDCGIVEEAAILPAVRTRRVQAHQRDALARLPAVRAGELSVDQAAELFLRLAYSHYLIPSPEPERLLQCMRSLTGLRTKPGH